MKQTVMMPITVSADDIAKQMGVIAAKEFEKCMQLATKTRGLKEYSKQSEVLKELDIGMDRLNLWYAMGLKKQIWSDRSIRIERSRLQEFLRDNFEV